jgi:hypothetical protein
MLQYPESGFELTCSSLSDLDQHDHTDIILLGNGRGQNLCDVVMLKAFHPSSAAEPDKPQKVVTDYDKMNCRSWGLLRWIHEVLSLSEVVRM